MKLLLINPQPRVPALVRENPALHLDLCEFTDAIMANVPGISLPSSCEVYAPGLLWLATYAQQEGIESRLVTYDEVLANGVPKDCCIGFTATAPDIPEVLRMVRRLREASPETLLALGGAHVQACSLQEADRLLREGINIVDRGNGSALVAILKNYRPYAGEVMALQVDSSSPSLLPGILTPDYDLLGDRITRTVPNTFTALGCDGRCVYCSSAQTPRLERNVAAIVGELEELSELLPEGRLVHFTDCDFLAEPSRAKRLLSRLPKTLRYSCDCHVVSAHPDLLEAMWASGFARVNFGIEDLQCNRARLRMRGIPSIPQRLRSARAAFPGVIRGYFMVGLPGSHASSAESFIESIRELLESRIIDIATVKTLIPYPGTYLHSNPQEFGVRLITPDLQHYVRLDHPVYELDALSAESIEQWLIDALLAARTVYSKRVEKGGIPPAPFASCNYTRSQVRRTVPDQSPSMAADRGMRG